MIPLLWDKIVKLFSIHVQIYFVYIFSYFFRSILDINLQIMANNFKSMTQRICNKQYRCHVIIGILVGKKRTKILQYHAKHNLSILTFFTLIAITCSTALLSYIVAFYNLILNLHLICPMDNILLNKNINVKIRFTIEL